MWFVPPEGISVLSDIDDILRFTQIYVPQNGLDNSFAYPFVPWSDMPSVYATWNAAVSLCYLWVILSSQLCIADE
jgi:hypothetical protein